jgi:hypothetical protein
MPPDAKQLVAGVAGSHKKGPAKPAPSAPHSKSTSREKSVLFFKVPSMLLKICQSWIISHWKKAEQSKKIGVLLIFQKNCG